MDFIGSSTSRTYLRASIAAILAGLSALGTGLVDESLAASEWVAVAIAVFGALGVYLGVGAASLSEPFYGKKSEVTVPSSARIEK